MYSLSQLLVLLRWTAVRAQEEQVHNHTWNAVGAVGGEVCIPLVLIQGCNHTAAADTLNKKQTQSSSSC